MKEKYELAYQDYLNGMKYKEIAAKYNVTINTVKSWKSRHWKNKRAPSKKVAHKKTVTKLVANMEKDSNELDEERQLFCVYYLKYHNATKAYQKIKPNITYASAMVGGCRLLKEPAVQNQIKQLKREMLADAMLEPCDIVQKYIDIAFLDNEELDGKAIRMSDCLKALDWLSKHIGMANEEQKAKIELIRSQTKSITSKIDDSIDEQIEDDGFLEALNATAMEDWKDE